MTESFGPYCGDRLDIDLPADKRGSCGRPFAGVEVRIVDPDTGAGRARASRARSGCGARTCCAASAAGPGRGVHADGWLPHRRPRAPRRRRVPLVRRPARRHVQGQGRHRLPVRGRGARCGRSTAVRQAHVTDVAGADGRRRGRRPRRHRRSRSTRSSPRSRDAAERVQGADPLAASPPTPVVVPDVGDRQGRQGRRCSALLPDGWRRAAHHGERSEPVTRAIDCLVNVDIGDAQAARVDGPGQGGLLQGRRLVPRRAPSCPSCSRTWTPTASSGRSCSPRSAATDDRAQRFVAERPERFALGVGGFNLLRPMKTVRALESFVRDHPVAYATVGPSFWGDGMYPPSDAVYYPLYTKCCELDLPLCMNTGIPGPPIPGEVQNPIHLDRVCVRFPELRLCMIHGADPWWDIAIRLHAQVPEPAADDLGVVAQAPARVAAALHAHPRQGPRSCSPPTTRCCRWSAASARRRRSTSRPRCSTAGSTATPRPSSSAGGWLATRRKALLYGMESATTQRRRGEHDGRQADRRRQPLLRAARRLHPAPRQGVPRARRAAGAGRQAGPAADRRQASTGSSPTRPSTRSSCPGCLDPLFRGQIPEGVDPRSLMQVEPLRRRVPRPRRAASR